MSYLRKVLLPILLATIWISISEFVRNTFFLHDYWIEYYKALGITFPEEPINGAVWGIWSLCFAIGIFIISRKFSLMSTTLLSWFFGFFLMWLVVGNMGVLPFKMLYFAIPLSLLESFVATQIIVKLSMRENGTT
jgi:hypothetical protein